MSYKNLNPTQKKNLEKIEEYLLEEREKKNQLSNFQEQIFWQIIHSFREHPSVKVRSFVVSKLKEYLPSSSLAKKSLALFLKDPSQEIVMSLIKTPAELADPQLFDLLLGISEQVKGLWERDSLTALYRAMYLSNRDKFVSWAKEIFGSKSFLKRKLLEEQKESLLEALLTQNDSVTFRFSGEFLKDQSLFLSQTLREKILAFREKIRVRRKTTSLDPRALSELMEREEVEDLQDPLPLEERISPSSADPSPPKDVAMESLEGIPGFSEFEELVEEENFTLTQRSFLNQSILEGKRPVEKATPPAISPVIPPATPPVIPSESSRKENRLKSVDKSLAERIPREFDDYILQAPIGIGGMGVVYRALQKSLGRTVAIKMLPPNYNPENHERFLQEAKIGAILNHPNIVHIISHGVVQSYPYFVMEYVDGVGLEELVARHRELSIERILIILKQIAQALSCAHRNNIIHRDIKASNIMINQNGDVKMMDFGLAKGDFGTTDLTQTGVIMGTPRYMAPEQASAKKIDSRADIYSLGVIFFELVTGELPFKGSSGMVVLFKHVHEAPPRPRDINPHVPSRVEEVILKCLEKNPDHRYQLAEELVEAIAQAQRELAGPVVSKATFETEKEYPFLPPVVSPQPPILPPSTKEADPLAEQEPSKEEDFFLAMYGQDSKKITLPVPLPPEGNIQKIIFYDLYYHHQDNLDKALEFLKFYFLESFQVEELQEERNELLEYLLGVGDQNLLSFLKSLRASVGNLFSEIQNSIIDMMIEKYLSK